MTEQQRIDADVVVTPGQRVRGWASWYRHDVVTLNGRVIGRIQTRRRNGRTDVTTCHDSSSSCVLGRDLGWLVSQEQAPHHADPEWAADLRDSDPAAGVPVASQEVR